MDDAALLFDEYGVAGIFVLVFAKRMGIPLPAVPFLLLAGARGVHDPLFAASVLVAATVAAIVADAIWFAAGRRFGRAMLALMCRISISPDTCIRKSELVFARRGEATVLFAKFIPGVAGLAPPLAGALGMRTGRFTLLNGAGTVLWVVAAVAAGLVLHRQVTQVVATLRDMGTAALPLVALAIAGYIGWLALRRALITLAAMRTPRLAPREVADKIARGEPVLMIDVRGRPSDVQTRIPGAVHGFTERELGERLPQLPEGVELVAYCDCPNDVSAAKVATMLRKRGLPAHVLTGGFGAWTAAGLPVEPAA